MPDMLDGADVLQPRGRQVLNWSGTVSRAPFASRGTLRPDRGGTRNAVQAVQRDGCALDFCRDTRASQPGARCCEQWELARPPDS